MKSLKTLVCGLLSAITVLGCAACAKGIFGEKYNLVTPEATSFHTLISWKEIEGATYYEVYKEGTMLGSTENLYYGLENVRDSIGKYTVVAKSSSEKSRHSEEVLVSKNSGFQAEEVLDFSERTSYHGTISSNVKKIIIGNETESTFALDVTLEKRTSDIIFELSNVAITGSIATPDKQYQRESYNFNVVFSLTGKNSINGIDGQNGADYSDSKYKNQEKNGGRGEDGGCPLIVSSAVFSGNGNLTLVGGNGGNGGNGSYSEGLFSTANPGKGSNGGDGGAGIQCAYCVLDMGIDGWVFATSGEGGKKGNPGGNGAVLSGPINSLAWSNYDIGKNGDKLENVIGQRIVRQGQLLK